MVNKPLGHINFTKATQSAMADVYAVEGNLFIVFNRELKDYHYTDYNFGSALLAQFKSLSELEV